MRWSESCIPTLKEDPREAEIPSHKLMLRAGLIKKLTAGVYTFLPLGFKVLKKIENIIREEMDSAGCQEVLMPVMHPIEIYEESGRIKSFGPELFKLHDSRNRLFALGPTHEEVITRIAREDMQSYRDLPQSIYQILIKFRDEIRPRYGVIRAREFIMKDAYSFHADDKSLDGTYRKMESAYRNIIERCGLEYRIVEAESGYIGGNESHEFMVLAENGEDEILSCGCGYSVNLEKASAALSADVKGEGTLEAMEEVSTPGASTVAEVSDFLEVKSSGIVKTLLYRAGDRDIAVLIPGDREINDIKLSALFEGEDIRFLEPDEIEDATGGPQGFSGPVGLNDQIEIIADRLLEGFGSMIVGANRADTHIINAVAGRDFEVDRYEYLAMAREGDQCPNCDSRLSVNKGIEVGHIFKLGTKYSSAMDATFLDSDGKGKHFIMGCYGFGVSRMIAAAIEQNYDRAGIIWPREITPLNVIILPVNSKDRELMDAAEKLESELLEMGMEILIDDRDLSPGVKFKDSELIGIPLRITVGNKLREGKVEILYRESMEVIEVPLEEASAVVKKYYSD
ncbi:MAG: proline--tRNA ligase [Candidatus Latescibacteria bacterium]|nr:proline--tRNA ligase [bacterium]MBD3425103.1 proline--tRNA ligase [Candidatus Latescibacterota bacterium]